MKLGLSLGYSGPQLQVPLKKVQLAERLGYDSVWTAEAYGSDAITPLAYIAAHTDRIRLGTGVIQLAALLFAPLFGYLIDKMSRVAGVALATVIAGTGYLWMGLLDSPMGPQAYPAAVVLGMGQVAAIVAATALVGQEASKELTRSFMTAVGLKNHFTVYCVVFAIPVH